MPDTQVDVSLWLKVPPWEIARRHPAGRFYTVDVVADKAATPEQIADAIKRRLAELEDRDESTAATSRGPQRVVQALHGLTQPGRGASFVTPYRQTNMSQSLTT